MGNCCGYLNNCSSDPISLSKESLSDKILYVIESESESLEKPSEKPEATIENPEKLPEIKAKKTFFLNDSPKSLRLHSNNKEESIDYTKSFTYKKENLQKPEIPEGSEKSSKFKGKNFERLDEELEKKIAKLISKENYKRNPSTFSKSRSFLCESISSDDEIENHHNDNADVLEIQEILEKESENIERKSPGSGLINANSISFEEQKNKEKSTFSKEKESTNFSGKNNFLLNESQNLVSGSATATLTLKSEQKPLTTTTLIISDLTTLTVNKKNNSNTNSVDHKSDEMEQHEKPRKSLLKCKSIGGKEKKEKKKKKKVKFTGEIKNKK